MILELHLIQNFAPSNLNRSDTGAPKDCIFGGSRRARISSQCFKRAMRDHFRENFARQTNLAERSTRLVEEIASRLEKAGKDKADAKRVVETGLAGIGLTMSKKEKGEEEDKEKRTEYLLFLGRNEIEKFTEICLGNYDALLEVAPRDTSELSTKDAKKAAKAGSLPEVSKQLKDAMDGGKAADLALFGRMLADLPDKNRYAASQVAHAISTHSVNLDFDFFTAVDDLKPEDTAGSDHLGTVEFNSACFYRYANVNVDKLKENLQGDEELIRATVEAFIRAAVEAIPTGKQNSFATHEKPDLIFAVVGNGGSGKCTLANAFVKPVKADEKQDLVAASVEAIEERWEKLAEGFGDDSLQKTILNISNRDLNGLKESQVSAVSELISRTTRAIFGSQEE